MVPIYVTFYHQPNEGLKQRRVRPNYLKLLTDRCFAIECLQIENFLLLSCSFVGLVHIP